MDFFFKELVVKMSRLHSSVGFGLNGMERATLGITGVETNTLNDLHVHCLSKQDIDTKETDTKQRQRGQAFVLPVDAARSVFSISKCH